ncbi:MAG: preprotein translocase subunit SecG [Chloroflexota bacterium]|nr:preprotein translocase subunit SecG [Chloroflexota bacterium]MDE2696930.1 preprotein translocase subunit SecG [Chloroflexota bacterium]MXZ46362.1 preprotein translocase subunit SecG [Chloroflexota bacterium]MXZ63036.1 preprotein translocase subunit SecG [Chloroflexota bacterium]MYE31859.1 preprotein translocase subunit SecG [Chloroflexota bacterium]
MELTSFLHIAQILVAIVLIAIVLMQVKGTGFGAALGGADQSFRTRRGIQKSLHRLTIVVVIVFIGFALWAVTVT